MTRIVEYINPIHQEIIFPLRKWKILSLNQLQEESNFIGSKSSFYKAIKKLEINKLVDSFIDSWSKEKHIYLDKEGLNFLGITKGQEISRDRRYHDALMVKICRDLQKRTSITKLLLDFEMKEILTSLDHLPDAYIEGEANETSYTMGLELELTQKCKKRIMNTFSYYSKSQHFNNVLFIFYKESTFNSYKKVLELNFTKDDQKKIILLCEPKLSLSDANIFSSKIYYNGDFRILSSLLDNDIPASFQCHSSDGPTRGVTI